MINASDLVQLSSIYLGLFAIGYTAGFLLLAFKKSTTIATS